MMHLGKSGEIQLFLSSNQINVNTKVTYVA